MSLSLLDVKRIARLARIKLAPEEFHAALEELNGVFALIEELRSIDTSGVAPLTTPLAVLSEVALRLRDDVVTESDLRDEYQRCAPSTREGLYLVPKVIE